jgi:nucleotide-binding universal stress UspA family protein
MRVLLAIDGSEQSEAAVDEVARRHFPVDSEVRVISVADRGMSFYGEKSEKDEREQARAAIEKAVARLRADEESLQFNITSEVLSGSPKRTILEEAESFGADLIVVGSHGHGELDRFLLGSVSQSVALHAKCSVEIVRRQKTLTSESK